MVVEMMRGDGSLFYYWFTVMDGVTSTGSVYQSVFFMDLFLIPVSTGMKGPEGA